jgi:hypothetical protein
MRTPIILDNADASTQLISDYINFDQRAAWKLFIESSVLDGVPKLFIQEATTNSICTPPVNWTIYKNNCSVDGSYKIDDVLVTIEKNDFKSNWFRILIEPDGNTTGTISARVSYKTFT